MQLVRTWALVAAFVFLMTGIGFLVVREYRSAESAECTPTYDVSESGVHVSDAECPEDRDRADEARGGY